MSPHSLQASQRVVAWSRVKIIYRGCPRCGGDLYRDYEDILPGDIPPFKCLMCAHSWSEWAVRLSLGKVSPEMKELAQV